MKERWRITLVAETKAAFHTLGPGRTLPLVDRPIQVDAEGLPVIPGSLVRGRVRAHLERLLRAMGEPVCQPPRPDRMCPHLKEVAALLPEDEPYCTACRIFGSAWRESAVVFSDLKLQNGEKESLFRTGVGISRRLGSAQAERLFTTEATAEGLRFAGEVEGLLTRKEVGWLLAAFKTVTHLGGDKARGLGQVCLSPESLERWDAEEGEWTAEDETKLIEEVLSYATD